VFCGGRRLTGFQYVTNPAILARLPEEQREVLLLVSLEGLSYDEVAHTLGVPAGTVMSRLSRGRVRLAALLEGEEVRSDAGRQLKVVK
jgi:RNA polymerase sigma-70 factor (ECF subfamily)